MRSNFAQDVRQFAMENIATGVGDKALRGSFEVSRTTSGSKVLRVERSRRGRG